MKQSTNQQPAQTSNYSTQLVETANGHHTSFKDQSVVTADGSVMMLAESKPNDDESRSPNKLIDEDLTMN